VLPGRGLASTNVTNTQILSIDEDTKILYGQIKADLRKKGSLFPKMISG
jgi:predicted nucleic acid-binding protein